MATVNNQAKIASLQKALDRERAKLLRQRDAMDATVSMIELIEAQIAGLSK